MIGRVVTSACVCANAPYGNCRGRECELLDVVISRKSLLSRSEGLGDGNGEIREPSILRFWGSKFGLRTWMRSERCIPQNKGT